MFTVFPNKNYLPLESSCMSGYSYWSPSISGSHCTLLSSWSTDGPCNLVAHKSRSSRSPPWWSCSGWSTSEGLCSRCCTHSSDLGNSCPRKRWSDRNKSLAVDAGGQDSSSVYVYVPYKNPDYIFEVVAPYISSDKQHSPCPWSPLKRFPMFSVLFILPLDKQSIVIQILP